MRCDLRETASADSSARTAAADWIEQRIKAMVGISVTATVLPPNSIGRVAAGKARRVFDERGLQKA